MMNIIIQTPSTGLPHVSSSLTELTWRKVPESDSRSAEHLMPEFECTGVRRGREVVGGGGGGIGGGGVGDLSTILL